MSEMVERVARAMAKVRADADLGDPWKDLDEEARELRRLEVYAAIAAMRDPTPAMERAGEQARDEADPFVDGIWAAMVEGALR